MRAPHLFACTIASGVILSVLLALTTPAGAQTVAWVNSAGGSYDTASNWLPAAIPNSGSVLDFPLSNTYTVSMPNPRTATSAFFDAGIVTFAGGNTLTLSSDLDVSTALLILSNANYAVSGAATLNTNGRIRITQGRLTVDSLQMARTLGDASLTVTGGSSSLVVNGPTASFVGQNGFSGTLSVTSSATASFGGAINLASSSTAGTTGVLSIGTSSTVTSSTIAAGTGGQTGQAGTILLNGDGARLTQSGSAALTLGATANSVGFMSIAANTIFTSGSGVVTVNPTGTINLAGTWSSNGDVNINGGNVIGTGTLSHFTPPAGDTVTVSNGGNMSLVQSSVFNLGTSFVVTGANSVLNCGTADIGAEGGSISVTNGGSLSAGFTGIGGGDVGTLTVSGPASGARSLGNLVVGYANGQGTAIISNGATLAVSGNVRLADNGSNATGTLRILSGATVSAAGLSIGDFGATASVLVSDPGSSLTITDRFTADIGDVFDAFGSLTIDNGGRFTTTNAQLTVEVTSHGRVDIKSGTFTSGGNIEVIGGTLNIGSGAVLPGVLPGRLELTPGHSLTVNSGSLNLLENGVLSVNGATIITPTINFAGGSLNFNAGTINFINTLSLNGFTISNLLGAQATLFPSHTLVAPTLALSGSMMLEGGTMFVGTLASGANLQLHSGSFTLTAQALTVGTGGTFAQLEIPSGLTFTTSGAAGTILAGNSGLTVNGGALQLSSPLTIAAGGQLRLLSTGRIFGFSSLTNNGLITGTGRIEVQLLNQPGGVLRAGPGDQLTVVTSGFTTNSGTIQLLGGVIEFRQPLTNGNGAAISGYGSLFTAALTNNGSLTLIGDEAAVFGAVTNSASARVLVTTGCNATFFDAVTNQAGSIFKVSDASVAAFLSPVTGLAAFTGNGTTIFESTASGGPLIAGTTVVDAGGGSLTATSIRQASLIVRGQAAIAPNGTNASTSRLNALTIDLGTVDLNDNDLVIDYTGVNPFNTVRSYLTSGALRSSLADATHRLGYADNAVLGLSVFSGQAVDLTSILVKYTFAGDANLDGQVDVTDLGALATNWQTSAPWTGGDFNYDEFVDVTDLGLLATNWQAGVGSPLARSRLEDALAAVGLSNTAVPEPALPGTLLFAGFLSISRRRGR